MDKYLGADTNVLELESIWEAYQSLLVDQALLELSKERPNRRSNLLRMVSIKKLFNKARMYMSQEELTVISQGKLKEYLR